MANIASISLRLAQRICDAHQLQPHRVHTFKRSCASRFADKGVGIAGRYFATPADAAVLSIEEKIQIQAPTAPGWGCRSSLTPGAP